MSPDRRVWTAIALLFILTPVVVGLAHWIGPKPPTLSSETTGSPELIAEIRSALGNDVEGWDSLAAALLEDGEVTYASFGKQADNTPVNSATAFEIGSLTKPLTGLLLADLIGSGSINVDETVISLIEKEYTTTGGPERAATVADVASHRSGAPRLPLTMLPRVFAALLSRADPFAGNASEVLNQAHPVDWQRSEYAYSNLGYAVLGNALAMHEGATYPALLQEHILEPLGMTSTWLITDDDAIPTARAEGQTASGFVAAPWTATGWLPAGVGVWSTAADLSRLLLAILTDDAPGMQAIEPQFKVNENVRIGYGWSSKIRRGERVHENAGGTGGFRTWWGMQKESDRAVILMSNTTRSVTALGRRLLMDNDDQPIAPASLGVFGWILALYAVFGPAIPLLELKKTFVSKITDRDALLRGIASALIAVAFTRVFVDWSLAPVMLWSIGVGLSVIVIAATIFLWSQPSRKKAVSSWRRGVTIACLLSGIFFVMATA